MKSALPRFPVEVAPERGDLAVVGDVAVGVSETEETESDGPFIKPELQSIAGHLNVQVD